MPRIIGIDLGTTFSALAYLEQGKAVMIEDEEGRRSQPSVVAFSPEDIKAGEDALHQNLDARIVRRIKRKMGTDYRFRFQDKEFSPEEISALIIRRLVEVAEQNLGEKIRDAIITVPAYFNDNQRQATKYAGEIAGLNVLRIINEPTAASLAYGIKGDQETKIVVFDLGGGTFDVSILRISEGIYEVVSTAGDNNLGGEDFTERIITLLVDRFKEETGIDLREDPLAGQQLYEAVEKAKKELSSQDNTRIHIPFITADESGPRDIDFILKREEFERLIHDYIKRSLELTTQAVEEGQLTLQDIDRIILVGGSSRIPYVQQEVTRLFGKRPDCDLNPEEVVAMGAAIQGGIIEGEIDDIVLVDVTPMSLGIEVENGYFVPVIERNTPVPTAARRIFTTVVDAQRSVDIHVLQGESMYVQNNVSLGKFRLDGLPQSHKGTPRIEVKFELDVNGILHVTAMDVESSHAQGITIVNESRLSEKEMKKLQEEHVKNYHQEIEKRGLLSQVLRLKTKADTIASRLEKLTPSQYFRSLLRQELSEVRLLLQEGVQELDIRKVQEALETLEFMKQELKAGNYHKEEILA